MGLSSAASPLKKWALACLALVAAVCICCPLLVHAKGKSQTVLSKGHLSPILAHHLRKVTSGKDFSLRSRRLGPVTIKTTIDRRMQMRAESILKSQNARRAALVVVEADTGRVLSLAGARRKRIDPRVALDHRGPAASLIKVVTAAAAMEEISLSPISRLSFVGRPHTLYRFQVRKRLRRKPRKITFAESFAKSNNPVFARLGMHTLGREMITWYGRSLGFDRALGFELPLGPSRMFKPKTNFQVGELACGYARTTTMSPVHAAMMVSVFVNGGRLMEPYVVDKALGAAGEVLYVGKPKATGSLVSEKTCRNMRRLFQATIQSGTAKRAFRRHKRDRVLRDLQLGGKTGTLRGPDRRELFEWFAGYGCDPRTGEALSVCALVVHGKVKRGNPKELARRMLREAFQLVKDKPTRMVVAKPRRPANL